MRCRAVFVILAEDPAADRLERCPRDPVWSVEFGGPLAYCAEHTTQLGWVRADDTRRQVYTAQVARFERQQTARVEQGALAL